MSMGHLYVLLGEGPIWVLCPFLNWIICLPGFESYKYLYNLEVKLLSDVLLANMFYHIVGSLFILMMVSLDMQKLFNLMQSKWAKDFQILRNGENCT